MNFLERRAEDCIQPSGSLGDHLAIEPTANSLTNTAYYAYDARIMERVVRRLGYKEDETRYAKLYERIKKAFNAKFVNEEGVTQAPYVPPFRRNVPAAPPSPDSPVHGEIRPVDT
jgi:alpha-L-rhamnosidase